MLRGAAKRNIKQAVFAVTVNDQHVSVETDSHLDNHPRGSSVPTTTYRSSSLLSSCHHLRYIVGKCCLLFFSARNQDFYRDALEEGFSREGARRSWDDFEIAATVPVIVHDEVEQAADFLRPMYALYFGGMGARQANFHQDVAVRLGPAGPDLGRDAAADGVRQRPDPVGDQGRQGPRRHGYRTRLEVELQDPSQLDHVSEVRGLAREAIHLPVPSVQLGDGAGDRLQVSGVYKGSARAERRRKLLPEFDLVIRIRAPILLEPSDLLSGTFD